MYKKNKIAIKIMFILVCIFETIALITYADILRLLTIGNLDALGLIALLPICIACIVVILILSIIITINYNAILKIGKRENLTTPVVSRVLMIISWVLLAINIIAFTSLWIVKR